MPPKAIQSDRRDALEISEAEEARIQACISADPASREPDDAQLERMRPASEVLPGELYAALTRPRGRPKAAETKLPVKLRLDRETVEIFKATGDGWQTRMNDALSVAARKIAKESRKAPVQR